MAFLLIVQKTIFTVFNNHFLTVLSCHFYTLKNGLTNYLTVSTLTVMICHFYSAKWSFCTCRSGHFITLQCQVVFFTVILVKSRKTNYLQCYISYSFQEPLLTVSIGYSFQCPDIILTVLCGH